MTQSRSKKTRPQALLSQFVRLEPNEREEFLLGLSEADWSRPQVNQWFRTYPLVPHASIVKTPGVCGGAARLIRTRIPVWTLARMRQLGISEPDILSSFPTLRAVDLVEAWSYVAANSEEIERAIRDNEEG